MYSLQDVDNAPEDVQPLEDGSPTAQSNDDKVQEVLPEPSVVEEQDQGATHEEENEEEPEIDAETRPVEEKLREALGPEDAMITEKATDPQPQEMEINDAQQVPPASSDVVQPDKDELADVRHDVEAKKDVHKLASEVTQSADKMEQSAAPEEHETKHAQIREDAVWEEFERERKAQEILARGKACSRSLNALN